MPLRLTIEAKPGKRIPSITVRGEILVVAVRERALDGRANAAVRRAVAAWLDVPIATVTIVHGLTARRKAIEIDGIDPALVASRIAAWANRHG